MKKIYRIEEFWQLNEGIVSSISSALSRVLSGKKSKIENIIKDIKNAKIEGIKEVERIEKQLSALTGLDNSEERFITQNLKNELRIISSLKEREVQALSKNLDKISKDNPNLEAFISSELAKIEVEVRKEMLKRLSPYKDEGYLLPLRREFDALVKKAREKEKELKKEIYVPNFTELEIDPDVQDFIDMDTQKASLYIKELSDHEIDKMHKDLRELKLNLEVEREKETAYAKKEIKKLKDSGDVEDADFIESQLFLTQNTLKKPLDRIRSRMIVVEKEIKIRRYGDV